MKVKDIIPFLDWNVELRIFADDNTLLYVGNSFDCEPLRNEICYITAGEDASGSYIALEVE